MIPLTWLPNKDGAMAKVSGCSLARQSNGTSKALQCWCCGLTLAAALLTSRWRGRRQSAQQGFPDAWLALGLSHLEPDSAAFDPIEAASWLIKAKRCSVCSPHLKVPHCVLRLPKRSATLSVQCASFEAGCMRLLGFAAMHAL